MNMTMNDPIAELRLVQPPFTTTSTSNARLNMNESAQLENACLIFFQQQQQQHELYLSPFVHVHVHVRFAVEKWITYVLPSFAFRLFFFFFADRIG